MKKQVKITETVLRDAQQSLIATRMRFDEFKDILPVMDEAGYYSLECWGGATFDACLRFLDEDPWERLRKIKAACPKTPLQMLLRGQNILGYHHYPDDVVKKFVSKSVENGIDIIRIFDALNDIRNVETAIKEAVRCSAHPSGTICFTTSPVHTLEAFAGFAKELEETGAESITIKDMAGIMSPQDAYDLVKAVKETVKIPVAVHTHSTTGFAPMTLLKAVEAGADIIDTSISSFSGGSSQAATESMAYALKQMGYEINLDEKLLNKINSFFKPMKVKDLQNGLLNPLVLSTDADAIIYQVPGGMLSNLVSQLEAQNKLELFEDVLSEVPKVRKDLGYPPLVTPMSQMVGVQAVQNILFGRYKKVTKEIESYLRGEYGAAPGEIDKDIQNSILNGEKPITGKYADTLEPLFEKTKAQLGDKAESDEDVLSYIAFPAQAERFFEKRNEKKKNTFYYSIKRIDREES